MNHCYMQQDVWIADSRHKEYVLYDSIYMKSKNRQNHVMVIESKTASYCFMYGGRVVEEVKKGEILTN